MKYAVINASASGSNTIVAGVAGKRIRVLSYVISSNSNVDCTFQSNETTSLTGPMALGTHGVIASSYGASTPIGLVGQFETDYGEALTLSLNLARVVAGHLTYILVEC